ncbi:unnamed protein product [Mesocestoides corti]|uniref:Protein xylosyltransferase n=1 Tax=Mesocestoides corti TaxID=53468 RepID=A0A0R3UBR9_MESCO|nr:unnamed protein product [Mesocestoides corti]
MSCLLLRSSNSIAQHAAFQRAQTGSSAVPSTASSPQTLFVGFIIPFEFPLTCITFTLLTCNRVRLFSRIHTMEDFAQIISPAHPYCRQFRQVFPIAVDPQADMDIAFTLVVHDDIRQIARLLRMIYRINNYYCIHIDKRSSIEFQLAMRGVVTCFGANVELVPEEERTAMDRGDESALLPQVICAKQALSHHATWKYLINLVDQDFPLRTNMELVAALKALNGSNLVESYKLNKFTRWKNNKLLPQGVILGRAVSPLREAMLQPNNIMHPDELFFPTLAYNSQLRLSGACLYGPSPQSEVGCNFLGRFVILEGSNTSCSTKYVRDVCILGKDHVALLRSVPHMFANTFQADYQPEAYDELEQWYFQRVMAEIAAAPHDGNPFDPSIYAKRLCSRLHI